MPSNLLLEDFQSQLYLDLTAEAGKVIRSAVWQSTAEPVLKDLVDDVTLASLAMNGLELKSGQLPDRPCLSRAYGDCIRVLGFAERGIDPPRLFIVDAEGMQAYTTSFVEPVIVVHAELLRRWQGEAELRFILGHELGHVLCGHVGWLTLFRAMASAGGQLGLSNLATLAVHDWSREAEIVCDRVGLICCQDREVAEQVLVGLAAGLDPGVSGDLDIDKFLEQSEDLDLSEVARLKLWWHKINRTHPFVRDRIVALREYATAKRYRHLW